MTLFMCEWEECITGYKNNTKPPIKHIIKMKPS